jgi:hypothetical protein
MRVPSEALGNVVELFERRKKDTNGTGALDSKRHDWIGVFGLGFTVQMLYEVVSDSLTHSIGWAVPAILPTQTPRIRGQVGKVGEQCVQIRASRSIGERLLQLVVKDREWSMRKAISINHHSCIAAGHSLRPPYEAKLLRSFHTSHTPLFL